MYGNWNYGKQNLTQRASELVINFLPYKINRKVWEKMSKLFTFALKTIKTTCCKNNVQGIQEMIYLLLVKT